MLKIDYTWRVLRFAIGSRILLLTLIVFWRSILSSYDTSASINPNCICPNSSYLNPKDIVFPSVGSAIEQSIVWDSVYFVRVAECGYEYEQTYAFLPLLPIIISLLSNSVFRPLVPLIGYRAVIGLSGYVFSNLAFVLAAFYLYRLSLIILKDPEASLQASVLFCLNPASIFYSSIYSESLYSLLTFGGLYYLISGAKNISVPWLALSGFARSNGVLNAGYFCFQTMHQCYNAIFVKRRASLLLRVLAVGLLRCICIFVPFIAFQAYGYYNLCGRRSSLEVTRPWCKATVPLLYNFIQSFLKYFQLKQLPNFLLASPILSLAVFCVYAYAKSQQSYFFTLGFSFVLKEKGSHLASCENVDTIQNAAFLGTNQESQNLKRRKTVKLEKVTLSHQEIDSSAKSGFFSPEVLPFVLHLAFMTATAFFVMHVQVATRFLSASPPLYWFAAYLMDSPTHKRWSYLIRVYSITYILLGSLLFSNFYPFT
ncbi:hypothetical protein V2J09_016299 [Rumex salicifolius]